MGRVAGKVAVVTGAARGQGRVHTVRLAEEGADVIAIDICDDIAITQYPGATREDLDETVRLVEKTGRKIFTAVADVRDRSALTAAINDGVAELGRLDVVVANAGISPIGEGRPIAAFTDTLDINLSGAMNTVHAALPQLVDGASVIIIGSAAGLIPGRGGNGPEGPGGAGYSLAKQTLVEYVNTLALLASGTGTRVNAVHPSNCSTQMLLNEAMYRQWRPDLENPSVEDAKLAMTGFHALPTPWVEPEDVSHAVVYLASDESRFVTGLHLKVDAGALVKLGL